MIEQSLEIVIPAYNEEKNIEKIVNRSLEWLKSQTKDYQVLVVDDGSSDDTRKILKSLSEKNKHIKVLFHKKNFGIGAAWTTLYKECSKDIIFSCPADLQFDPFDFSKTLEHINGFDIISVYRPKKEDYSMFRQAITNIHRIILKIFFKLNIRDINWVKMYKKWTLKDLDIKSKSVLIETEILAKVKKRKGKIIQLSAPYHRRLYGVSKGSSLKHLFQVYVELIRLYWIVKIFK